MINLPFIVRCDAGISVGMGHYSRCLSLVNALKKRNIQTQFALKLIDDNQYLANILNYDILIKCDYVDEADTYGFKDTFIILDNFHQANIYLSNFEAYLVSLKKNYNNIALIQGMGAEACPEIYHCYLDALVTPYFVTNIKKEHQNIAHFSGKKYLLLDVERIIQDKRISPQATNLLITFGGSDPHHQTIQILDSIIRDKRFQNLQIKVILGSWMSTNRQEKISKMVMLSSHNHIEIIIGLTNIASCFEWADVAITNTGQTRYELAASGVPFVIIPFDQPGYDASRIFEDWGCAILQSWPVNDQSSKMNDVIINLLGNYEKREEMSRKGIEGFCTTQGADRLVEDLLNETN